MDRLRDFWCNIKHTNVGIIGIPEGEQRCKREEKLFEEIRSENCYKLGEENRHPDPGGTKNPKQYIPKDIHTKTYYN